jgi:hypothetical protein
MLSEAKSAPSPTPSSAAHWIFMQFVEYFDSG